MRKPCRMRKFGGPPFPRKKLNLGLVEMQLPAVLKGLLVDILLGSQFPHPLNSSSTPPPYFYANLDELRDPHFQKSGDMYPQDSLWAPSMCVASCASMTPAK